MGCGSGPGIVGNDEPLADWRVEERPRRAGRQSTEELTGRCMKTGPNWEQGSVILGGAFTVEVLGTQ